jgi:hypothetical protein
MANCPAWCIQPHDPEEIAQAGYAHHSAAPIQTRVSAEPLYMSSGTNSADGSPDDPPAILLASNEWSLDEALEVANEFRDAVFELVARGREVAGSTVPVVIPLEPPHPSFCGTGDEGVHCLVRLEPNAAGRAPKWSGPHRGGGGIIPTVDGCSIEIRTGYERDSGDEVIGHLRIVLEEESLEQATMRLRPAELRAIGAMLLRSADTVEFYESRRLDGKLFDGGE